MNRDELVAAYTAPGRYYHNLRISKTASVRSRASKIFPPRARNLSEAIWWHDVVYDATRADNEELSARLAEQHVREDFARKSAA